jgi:hypothetical protein
MPKSYPELLGDWVRQRETSKRDKNLVAFLAVRDDVKEAFDAGYSVTTIWTYMHEKERVAFGYDTFLNYVNRYIRSAQKESGGAWPGKAKERSRRRSAAPVSTTDGKGTGTEAKVPDAMSSFTFNSAPKKEDLI